MPDIIRSRSNADNVIDQIKKGRQSAICMRIRPSKLRYISCFASGSSTIGFEVVDYNTTGPLTLRRIISVVWSGDEKLAVLREYEENQAILNQEKREQQGQRLGQNQK